MGIPEDDFIKNHFRTANPNPKRIGCPSREILAAAARRSLPLSSDVFDHFANCSECTLEISAIRNELRARHWRRVALGAASVAAALVVIFVVGSLTNNRFFFRRSPTQIASIAHLKRTADLFDEPDMFRGGDEPQKGLKTIQLPPAPLELRVVLPRFSRPGMYQIAICRDRSEASVLVKAVGHATADGAREVVTVMLDLSGVSKGSYWLATRGDDEGGSYYFPTKITAGA